MGSFSVRSAKAHKTINCNRCGCLGVVILGGPACRADWLIRSKSGKRLESQLMQRYWGSGRATERKKVLTEKETFYSDGSSMEEFSA